MVVVVLPYIAHIPLSEQQAGHQCVSDTSPLPPSLPDAQVLSLTLQNHSSLPPLSQTGGRTSLHVSVPIPSYTSFYFKGAFLHLLGFPYLGRMNLTCDACFYCRFRVYAGAPDIAGHTQGTLS